MSERSLRAADVAQLTLYAPGEVVIDKEKATLLAALILAPFAVENGVDPNHIAPKYAARQILEWLKGEMEAKRGDTQAE